MQLNTLDQQIRMYEELAINSHPALQTQLYDGWQLRFSNGYTGRANSISMLYPSTIDEDEKIAECERRYAEQNLACNFKITEHQSREFLEAFVRDSYDLTPRGIIDGLELLNVDYNLTSAYGHFTNAALPWEQ